MIFWCPMLQILNMFSLLFFNTALSFITQFAKPRHHLFVNIHQKAIAVTYFFLTSKVLFSQVALILNF